MSFNTTANAYFNSHYKTTDLSSLNWIELKWAAWYMWWANDRLATGVMGLVMHEVPTIHSSQQLRAQQNFGSWCILVDAYHGSSSTPSPTSENGNFSLPKYRHQKNNGIVQNSSSSLISRWNSPWYVVQLLHTYNSPLQTDHVLPFIGRIDRNGDMASPLALSAGRTFPARLLLRL